MLSRQQLLQVHQVDHVSCEQPTLDTKGHQLYSILVTSRTQFSFVCLYRSVVFMQEQGTMSEEDKRCCCVQEIRQSEEKYLENLESIERVSLSVVFLPLILLHLNYSNLLNFIFQSP